jgi:hypothetical protein
MLKKREREGGLAEGSPHYYGHRERLRERFREAGADALSDYELLEAVLFRAQPRRDVKPLAKALIASSARSRKLFPLRSPVSVKSKASEKRPSPNWRRAGSFAAK